VSVAVPPDSSPTLT